MVRLAICDDEPLVLQKIEKDIKAFNQQSGGDAFSVASYDTAQALYDSVTDQEVYDAFLLDIEMKPMNGIELAGKLRELFPYAAIVFLSSHTGYALMSEGYRVQALRYISKETMDTGIPEALSAIVRHCKTTRPLFYTYTHYSSMQRIPLQDILYVHRVARMTELVTEKQGSFQMKKPLRDLFAELNDQRFLFIDRSCFVNIDHIIQVFDTYVVLQGGKSLPVSRKLSKSVREELLRVWGGLK